jgi:phosphate acetyltransferase
LTQVNAAAHPARDQWRMEHTFAGLEPFDMDGGAGHGREKYQRLLALARRLPPVVTAVVHPCDEVSLAGAVEAYRLGLISPILVAPKARLTELARQNHIDISGLPLVAS